MKRVIGLGIAALITCAGPALAQNDKPKAPAPANAPKAPAQPGNAGQPGKPGNAPEVDPMMEAMMKAAQPGPQHAAMAKLAGTWETAVKMFESPDKAEESKGSMVYTPIHGGRYLHMEYKGEMMGGPFSGSGIWGYDNTTKQYVSTWCDNWSTGIMFMTGTYDAASKTYTSTGEMSMPMPDGSVMKMKQRETVKIISDDKHIMEMYGPGPDGKEMKHLEITYTRKK